MGLLAKMFNRNRRRAQLARSSVTDVRLNLLSRSIRETLLQHGIPLVWLSAETLPAKTGTATGALHLRLVLKSANPMLLAHAYALQRAIQVRLGQLDQTSGSWLTGTSWRIDIPVGSDTTSLPGADFWRSGTRPRTWPTAAAARRERLSRELSDRDGAFARLSSESPEFAPTVPMPG